MPCRPDRPRRASWAARAAVGAALSVGGALGAASPAFADAPGPTDFETTILEVDPPVDGVQLSIVGGDAFVALDVEPGIEVVVPGYQDEPFLEFLASGEVRENRRSPTYFASREKYGAAVPDGITADTAPEWTVVSRAGSYAWHDHRAHWMGGTPPGRRGDVVQEGSIPLIVDGRQATVRLATVWLPDPAPAPALVGLAIGAVLGALAALTDRRAWMRDAVTIGASVVALAIGSIGYLSVPSSTGPPITAWLGPLTAVLASVAAHVINRRHGAIVNVIGMRLLAGGQLMIWAFTRRAWLTAAILPTVVPGWLDRAATSAVGALSVTIVGAALIPLIERLTRPPRRA